MCVSLLALGFSHHKGLSFQIYELENSGLPQQGILPISARKTTTNAIHRCLEKTLSTVQGCKVYSQIYLKQVLNSIFADGSLIELSLNNHWLDGWASHSRQSVQWKRTKLHGWKSPKKLHRWVPRLLLYSSILCTPVCQYWVQNWKNLVRKIRDQRKNISVVP